MPALSASHLSLARSYLRQVRHFPDQITRSYLVNLLHKRVRRPHGSHPERLQARMLKTVNFLETVRLRVAAANSGHVSVFEDLLKEAFGRTGERREFFLKPFLTLAPQHVPTEKSYPESEFPIYPPLLASLLTSPVANAARKVPTIDDLQSIPPPSLITNTWSDLPPELQPDLSAFGKAQHMGVLHPARQINHRHRLRRRWLGGLIGPPLGPILPSGPPGEPQESHVAMSARIEADFGTVIDPSMIAKSEAMLQEIRGQAAATGPSGASRYAPPNLAQASKCIAPRPKRPACLRVPSILPASHPLTPTPVPTLNPDPLRDLLPKSQQPAPPPRLPLSLKHGPRTVTSRLIRRRYQQLLTMIPVLSTVESRDNLPSKEKEITPKGMAGVDRSWITPEGRKRVAVKRAGPELGTAGLRPMEGEDLLWMNSNRSG